MNTPTNLFSRERFEAWLVGQPLDRRFNYADIRGCVFASFLRETTLYSQAMFGSCEYMPTPEGGIEACPSWVGEMSGTISAIADLTAFDVIAAYNRLSGVDLMEMDKLKIEIKEVA